MPGVTDSVTNMLNSLLGAYWGGMAQHQTHMALIESWGLAGLAQDMRAHIDDEPVTVRELITRLLDLGGAPDFTIVEPSIGTTLREALDNDLQVQLQTRPALNAAAEVAASAHDATTRILIEGILADEELHLSWLATELDLLDRMGGGSLHLQPPRTSAGRSAGLSNDDQRPRQRGRPV